MRDASPLATAARIPSGKAAEAFPRRYWKVPGVPVEKALAAKVAKDADLEVFVNEGRWVAGCSECGGAQLAARTDHRFMCHICGNVAAGGRWRRVIWPADVAAIEAALAKRPQLRTRNWSPGETVEQLLAENEHQGPVSPAFDRTLVGKASAWEGHAHTWPKRATNGRLTCAVCDLTLPERVVREAEADEEAGS